MGHTHTLASGGHIDGYLFQRQRRRRDPAPLAEGADGRARHPGRVVERPVRLCVAAERSAQAAMGTTRANTGHLEDVGEQVGVLPEDLLDGEAVGGDGDDLAGANGAPVVIEPFPPVGERDRSRLGERVHGGVAQRRQVQGGARVHLERGGVVPDDVPVRQRHLDLVDAQAPPVQDDRVCNGHDLRHTHARPIRH